MTSIPSPLKRKTLHDYFATPSKAPKASPSSDVDQAKPSRPPPVSSDVSIRASPPTNTILQTSVPGLTVIPNFVTPSEQTHLISFLNSQPWRTDLSRRTMHFGGTYCLMPPRDCTASERKRVENQFIQAPSIPPEMTFLVDKLVDARIYNDTTDIDNSNASDHCPRPEYCIVNSYHSTNGISAHVENFRFASPVVGLSLLCGDTMRFHQLSHPDDGSVRSGKAGLAPRTGKRVDVWLPARSLVVMRGESRWSWQHEIPSSQKRRREREGGEGWRRVSLTFRVEKPKKNGERR